MLGVKARNFREHDRVCLENFVPPTHFYRQLDHKLDLSFVRTLLQDKYCGWNGRPSLDPVVFFKLQLIMFFEDIRSERQLMEQVAVNLAFRWYIGYDLDEAVPHHSSLSKIRQRYGLKIFQQFFEKIIEHCIAAGLVWGKELYFDGTLVEANADYDKQSPRFYEQAHAHLGTLFEEEAPTSTVHDHPLVHKYDGHQRMVKASAYQREADYWVNPTDPDASPMGKFKMGYRTHYVVDGGKARIILACLVTPTTIQDNTPMIDLASWVRFRWQVRPEIAVADQRYGTIENVLALEHIGIKAFMPLVVADAHRQPHLFPRSRFHYDAQHDYYRCPQGEILYYTQTRQDLRLYRTRANVCKGCPLRAQCTTSPRGRAVTHSIHKSVLDRVASYQKTAAYQKAMRKRQVWIEPKFAEIKLWHHGRRFRLRRIHNVNIEALLKASGQNIKQLMKRRTRLLPLPPANVAFLTPHPPLQTRYFSSCYPCRFISKCLVFLLTYTFFNTLGQYFKRKIATESVDIRFKFL